MRYGLFVMSQLSISIIKEDISIIMGIRTNIIYLSIRIGCLINPYNNGIKYEKNKINISGK